MLSIRPQNRRPIQTESEGLERNIPSKWTGTKNMDSNTYIGQNRFQKKTINRDKESHFITLNGRTHQEDINIINICAPYIGAPKYIGTILEDFKKDIYSNLLTVGDFNIPLSTMDRYSKKRINKDILALKNTLDQKDLICIHRTIPPKEAKYTIFSNTHGIFSKIDHMVGQKRNLNNFNLKSYQASSQITMD